jgi:hypothetical protein
VKLLDPVINFSNGPAVSYCTYQLNKDSTELNSSNNKNSKRLNAEFIENIRKNIQERNISKYLAKAKNEMPSYISWFIDNKNKKNFTERNYLIMSFSNLGECYTLSPSRYSPNKKHKFVLDVQIVTYYFSKYKSEFLDLNPQTLVHDPNQLPSLTFRDHVQFDLCIIEIERLPPPYDSNCFDYENIKSFNSRGQCINDCIFRQILKKYGCIPRKSINVLTLYENMTLDSNFCVNNNFENFSEDDCSDRCPKPCKEIFYISFKTASQDMISYEAKNVAHMHKIYMNFTYFMSSIGGLLGLWNNISFYDLQLIIIKICGKIFKLRLMRKLLKYFFSLKIFKSFYLIRSFVIKINLKVKNI